VRSAKPSVNEASFTGQTQEQFIRSISRVTRTCGAERYGGAASAGRRQGYCKVRPLDICSSAMRVSCSSVELSGISWMSVNQTFST